MKPLVKVFLALCLVSFVLSMPLPEGEEEAAGTEEAKGDTTDPPEAEGSTEDKEGEPEEAAPEDGEEKEGEGQEDQGEPKDEGEGSTDDAGKGDDSGSGSDKQGSKDGSKKDDKGDPVDTYYKVIIELDKATDESKIEDSYLRSYMTESLQNIIRNPIIDAVKALGHFDKIKNCFQSLAKDVQGVLTEKSKKYAECKKKEKKEYECAKENSNTAGSKFQQFVNKIKGCVHSNSKN